jgi:hypothetical protein
VASTCTATLGTGFDASCREQEQQRSDINGRNEQIIFLALTGILILLAASTKCKQKYESKDVSQEFHHTLLNAGQAHQGCTSASYSIR